MRTHRAFVSSAELSDLTGVSDVQIRKDISNFGKVGTPRVGYGTSELKSTLENFVLHEEVLYVAVFGVGNLGTALMSYPGFGKGKLKIVAAFDKDAEKIGEKVNGIMTYCLDDAGRELRRLKVNLGVISVPGEHSQSVADLLVVSGVKAIVNFSPVWIQVPDDVWVKDIDLSLEFLATYYEAQVIMTR